MYYKEGSDSSSNFRNLSATEDTSPESLSFETQLMKQFEDNPEWKTDPEHGQVWKMLEMPDCRMRRRRIRKMEQKVRAEMGRESTSAIDWSKLKDVDWLRVLQWIGAILAILLLI